MRPNPHAVLTVLLAAAAAAAAASYDQLQQLGISCPAKDSCRTSADAPFTQRNCECDPDCRVYGDCCVDARHGDAGVARRSSARYACMAYGFDSRVGAYVVDRCPASYDGPGVVRRKCQGRTDWKDPLMAVPVTDHFSGLTYRNRYCAECNEALSLSLEPWKIFLNFNTLAAHSHNASQVLRRLRYNGNLRSWGVRLGRRFHGCDLIFDRTPHLTQVRLCRANLVSHCPAAYPDPAVRQACAAYTAVVYDTYGSFRNVHCALCHGKQVRYMSCDRDRVMSLRQGVGMSFGLLMDFNFSSGNSVGRGRKEGVEACRPNEVYDPFKHKCRRIQCALPGYSLVNRRCYKDKF